VYILPGGGFMQARIEKCIESIVTKGLYEILKYLLLLIFSSGFIGFITHITTSNISFLSQYAILITTFVAAGGGFLCFLIYERVSSTHPKFPALEFHFKVLEKEYTYEYLDKNHMTFRKRIKLKALRNNLDRYHDRYCWTGVGGITIQSEFEDQELLLTARKDIYHEYDILFGRNLKKGEEIETCLFFDLEDTENQAVPFLSTTVAEPTDYQVLRVIIPKSFGVEKAIAEIFPCADSFLPLETKIINFSITREAKWEMKKPKLLYVHSMRWNI
jgi:hypothetical protein